MQRGDAAAEISIFHVLKSNSTHEFHQLFLAGKLHYRVVQVLIRACITRNDATDTRKNVTEIQPECFPENRYHRFGEFQNNDSTVRTKEPMKFAEATQRVFEIPQPKSD